MASKRSATEVFEEDIIDGEFKRPKPDDRVKKHTLDSDEEDSGDDETYT